MTQHTELIDTMRGLVPRYQADRYRAFLDAIGNNDFKEALRIARAIVPEDATEEERKMWGAHRRICWMALMSAD